MFASGITSVGYVIRGLFKGSSAMTMQQLFWTDSSETGSYKFTFTSTRIAGRDGDHGPVRAEPVLPVGDRLLSTTVGAWRTG